MMASERFSRFDLVTPTGTIESDTLLPFRSLEHAFCDVQAGISATAADLLREGVDPMVCS